MFNNKQILLHPPQNMIKCNCSDDYKDEIYVDVCLEREINTLWIKGIHTCGCCCGHNIKDGFIQVINNDIEKMIHLGYKKYIYEDEFGGVNRNDAFIPLSICRCYEDGIWCDLENKENK